MLGRNKELKDLRDRSKELNRLVNELNNTVLHVELNGMPLYHSTLYQLMLVLRFTANEVELVKTHGNARVEAKVYGTIKENND